MITSQEVFARRQHHCYAHEMLLSSVQVFRSKHPLKVLEYLHKLGLYLVRIFFHFNSLKNIIILLPLSSARTPTESFSENSN